MVELMTSSNLETAAETPRSLAKQVCEEQRRQHVWTASLMVVDVGVVRTRKNTWKHRKSSPPGPLMSANS